MMSDNVAVLDRLAAILAEARPRLTASDFSEKRKVIGLLSDKAPDAKREIRAMAAAIDEGVPTALARTDRPMLGVEMDRLSKALEDNTGLRPELARQVVRAFAFALGMGPPPSIYEAGAAPVAPSAPPQVTAPPVPAPTHAPPMPPRAPYVPPQVQQQPYAAAAPYQPQQGGYQQPPPMGYAPPPKKGMTGGRIALLVVGGVVILAGLAKLGENSGRGGGSTIADWTCPRIADRSVELSQSQPIRLRSITNVRETSRTTNAANCLGLASTENGDTGDVYMRAYIQGSNIMVGYQGEPFGN